MFQSWCETKLENFDNLNIEDVFLGTDNETSCTLILLAKKHIYSQRFENQPPDFPKFTAVVNNVRNTELCIARKNNRVDKWLKKWEKITL